MNLKQHSVKHLYPDVLFYSHGLCKTTFYIYMKQKNLSGCLLMAYKIYMCTCVSTIFLNICSIFFSLILISDFFFFLAFCMPMTWCHLFARFYHSYKLTIFHFSWKRKINQKENQTLSNLFHLFQMF